MVDMSVDQLLPQVGRGVDQDSRCSAFRCPLGQQRTAAAAVLRIFGITGPPAERRTRHAGRGSAAEDRERQGHAIASADGTLLKRRKKFSVVCREISSSETPRVSASTLATSTT